MNNRLRPSLRPLALLLVGLLLLSLGACSSVPKLETGDGRYHNAATGVTYLQAPPCYRAASYKQDAAIAKIAESKVDDVILYQINESLSPDALLATDRFDLFYAEGTTLPTLAEMAPHRVHVGLSDAITVTFSMITNASEIAELVSLYGGALSFSESEVIWLLLDKTSYELRFESKAYDGIYYYLDYYHCSEEVLIEELVEDMDSFTPRFSGVEVTFSDYNGATYAAYHFGYGILRDPATGLCYPVWDLIAPYVDGIEA